MAGYLLLSDPTVFGRQAGNPAAKAVILEPIRLDYLSPSVSDMPTFNKLAWQRFKGKLVTDKVHKESRAVSSGMNYIGYVILREMLAEQKNAVERTRAYLNRLPEEHETKLKQARSDLTDAESCAEQKARNKTLQKQYQDKALVLRMKIGSLENDCP